MYNLQPGYYVIVGLPFMICSYWVRGRSASQTPRSERQWQSFRGNLGGSPGYIPKTSMNFVVRTAREEDAESIVELLNLIIRQEIYSTMDRELTVEEQIAFMRVFPERGVFNVALCQRSGRVLGMQDVMPVMSKWGADRHIGEISTFVSLDLHRQGIGRSLCKMTFPTARERGFRKITATIRADNPQGIAFYSKQGFSITGFAERYVFVRGGYIDVVFAEKLLD